MTFIIFLAKGIFLYIIPGFFLLIFFKAKNQLDWLGLIGPSSSLVISLNALFFLWGSLLGIRSMGFYTLAPLALTLVVIISQKIFRPKKNKKLFSLNRPDLNFRQRWLNYKNGHEPMKTADLFFLATAVLVIFLIFFSRWQAIRNMIAPAWGDSVHHTLIVQLILKNEGLFKSWHPYAPLETLSYHFGAHSNVACWAWLSGQSAHKALLQAGQFFNGLAVIGLYSLAFSFSKNRWLSLAVMAIAGLLFPFPAYFVNWGRYTQLVAMIILPNLLWLVDSLINNSIKENKSDLKSLVLGLKGFDLRCIIFLIIMASGLFLTHYSIFLLDLIATAAWFSYFLIKQGFKLKLLLRPLRIMIISFFLVILIISPWILRFKESRLVSIFFSWKSEEKLIWQRISNDFWVWSHLNHYFPDIFWILSVFFFIFALILREKVGLFFLFFSLYSFIVANLPTSILPGRRFLSNSILVFSLYLPISNILAWGGEKSINLAKRLFLFKNKLIQRGVLFFFISSILFYGVNYQIKIVDPFFQMVTVNDLRAFAWIRENTPKRAKFLINGFLIYEERAAAGSDAGWWLPYFTGRQTSIPPLVYNIEKLSSSSYLDRTEVSSLIRKIKASHGNQEQLREILKSAGIEYVFLGEKRGLVGYDQGELIPESWLRSRGEGRRFKLLFQEGKAQVWKITD